MQNAHAGLNVGLATSAAGLQMIRVATAAARKQHGQSPLDVELRAIDAVVAKLRSEVDLLLGRRDAVVADEPGYAMASFTLDALHSQLGPVPAADADREGAVIALQSIIDQLQRLHDADGGESDAEFLEWLFLASGTNASQSLSSTGEKAPTLL